MHVPYRYIYVYMYVCVEGDIHAHKNNGRVLNIAELMITVLT